MYSSRFSLPAPDVAAKVIKDSYLLKLELFCFEPDDGDPPTIEGSYEIKGSIKLKPDDDHSFLTDLLKAFRAAQAGKGGCDEANC